MPSSNASPDPFLQLCLAARWDSAALEEARTLAQRGDLDWPAWRRVAPIEALTPLLYHILHGQKILPAWVDKEFGAAYLYVLERNIRLFRELERALLALAAEGVQVLLLKGASLAVTVYGNVALRHMADLDLLVHEADTAAALRALQALGYTTGSFFADHGEAALHKASVPDTHIDLHWHLLTRPYYRQTLPVAWFWQTALPVTVGDAVACVLGPEAQLLHLCGHLALHHRDDGPMLLWHHDVAEVIHYYAGRLDWQELLARAQAFDLLVPLQRVLPQLADGWRVPVPAEVLAQLRVLRPSPAEARVHDWLGTVPWTATGLAWAHLAGLQGWGARLGYVAMHLFPPAAFMRQRYPLPHPVLLPLTYPWRWLVGVGSGLVVAWARLRSACVPKRRSGGEITPGT